MRTTWYRFIAISGTAVLIGFVATIILLPHKAVSDTAGPVTGYAWSDTIGWISMNCAQSDGNTCSTASYGITMNANGNLSGYAWSDAIGWISANETTGCPSGTCQPSVQNGKLTGWLRACAGKNDVTTSPTNQSVSNNTCNGWTRTDGWDGWISLAGTNGSVIWGVSYDSTTGAFGSDVNKYAWGSDVVGWVDFSQVQKAPTCPFTGTYCKNTQQLCQVDPLTCVSSCSTCSYTCCGNACCSPTPFGTFTATPSVVKPGGTSIIAWNYQNVKSCSVTGDNGDGVNPQWQKNADVNDVSADSHLSSGITRPTTYTLDCKELDPLSPDYFKTVQVNIVPVFKEI